MAVWIGSAAGCKKVEAGEDHTRGELGRVSFNYKRSCFFGCPLEQPLLAGTRERIGLTGAGDDEGVHVRSNNPEHAEFALERECFCERSDNAGGRIQIADDARCEEPFHKHCDNDVLVQAGSAGAATLELLDARDRPIDRASVRVADAAEAEFEATFADHLGAISGDDFELTAGQSFDLALALFDDEGRKLLAPEGVHYRVQDADVATVTAFLLGGGAELRAGLAVVVDGKTAGETMLSVDVPGLEAAVMIRVR
jgi:hypothetical protein